MAVWSRRKAFSSEGTANNSGQEPPVTFHHASAPRLHIGGTKPGPHGSIRVVLAGELDQEEADRLHAGIEEVVQRHAPASIDIDATQLTFLDSAGIRALLTCHRSAGQNGSRMSISQVHPHVFQVLEITGLLELFAVVEKAADRPGEAADQATGLPPVVIPDDERESA
jgi:stage II sporulation protein AA (anti-sigma F factor antagonist)